MFSNWKKLKNLITSKVYFRLLSSWCFGSMALVMCYIKQKIHLAVYDIAGTMRSKQWHIGTVHMQQNINCLFFVAWRKIPWGPDSLMIFWSYTIKEMLHVLPLLYPHQTKKTYFSTSAEVICLVVLSVWTLQAQEPPCIASEYNRM